MLAAPAGSSRGGDDGDAPQRESLSSDAFTFLMYLLASVRMIEDTYFSNMAAAHPRARD
jgi:hypothetical protein